MEYVEVEKPEKHNGGLHFGHEIRLNLKRKREEELFDYLNETVGEKHKTWRFSYLNGRSSWYYLEHTREAIVRFTNRDHAMLFKLGWSECEPSEPSVIIPFLRRVMPSIIAQQIIGVQPMIAPVSPLYTLKTRYVDPTSDQDGTPSPDDGSQSEQSSPLSGDEGKEL